LMRTDRLYFTAWLTALDTAEFYRRRAPSCYTQARQGRDSSWATRCRKNVHRRGVPGAGVGYTEVASVPGPSLNLKVSSTAPLPSRLGKQRNLWSEAAP